MKKFSDKQFKHNDLCLGIRRDIREGANVVLGACTSHSTKWELHGVNLKIEQHQVRIGTFLLCR